MVGGKETEIVCPLQIPNTHCGFGPTKLVDETLTLPYTGTRAPIRACASAHDKPARVPPQAPAPNEADTSTRQVLPNYFHRLKPSIISRRCNKYCLNSIEGRVL